MALTSMGLNPKQTQTILSRKFGYTGSTQTDEMEAFMQSKPEAEPVILKMAKAALKRKGMNTGGVVSMSSDIQPTAPRDPTLDGYNQVTNTFDPISYGTPLTNTTATTSSSAPGEVYQSQIATPNVAFLAPLADQDIAKVPEQDASKVQTASVVGNAQQAGVAQTPAVATMTPESVMGQVKQETEATQAEQGTVAPEAQVTAQQQLTTSVSGLEAAQGTATMVDSPAAREIQDGELISGAADAEKAALFTEQIDAATATPTKQATVQGQLEGLMQQFEGGETPAWASGAMRTATATLAARGLGASSMAGQAVVQAAMEAALPIAQADANVTAQFEAQNLSNRQQRAMVAAQQRATFLGMEFDQAFQARVANASKISDVANMNFTSEQQIALENARATNTMNLNNLSNQQAMVMAEAAALSNLDTANLNNRQQAAVQNAQNFLQMDMQNLSNSQQTSMFRAQQNIQALLTDQAAENAALQFNAASENQTNQFFADLQANVAKFNSDQANTVAQFDANAVNATYQFNVAQDNAFRQFMISQNLAVSQANAKWRQSIATTNQQAQNEAAFYTAKELNGLSQAALDEIWQRERDEIDYVYTSFQSDADRANAIILQKLAADAKLDATKLMADIQENAAVSEAFYNIFFKKR